jgi:hypothetical protein
LFYPECNTFAEFTNNLVELVAIMINTIWMNPILLKWEDGIRTSEKRQPMNGGILTRI